MLCGKSDHCYCFDPLLFCRNLQKLGLSVTQLLSFSYIWFNVLLMNIQQNVLQRKSFPMLQWYNVDNVFCPFNALDFIFSLQGHLWYIFWESVSVLRKWFSGGFQNCSQEKENWKPTIRTKIMSIVCTYTKKIKLRYSQAN